MAIVEAPFELQGRPVILLADGAFSTFRAKTAVCYLRYRSNDVVAVLDAASAAATVQQVVGFGGEVPIVATLATALNLARPPEVAIVGTAPRGGGLTGTMRAQVIACLQAGLDVVSGLHAFLADDPGVVAAADAGAARFWDVRRAGGPFDIGSGRGCTSGARCVMVVGSDCNVGKMTATVQLYEAARRGGINAAWAATGQTGMMLRGRGVCVDRVVSDFVSGAAEELVNVEGAGRDLLLVEGQGSLVHPGYAAVTLGLLFGVMPDCMVLVHPATRTEIGESGFAMPPLGELIALHERFLAPFKPARVVAIAVNTVDLDEAAAAACIDEIATATGLPAADPVRGGEAVLLQAVMGERS